MEFKEVKAKLEKMGFHEADDLVRSPVVPGCCGIESWWRRGKTEVVYVFVYGGEPEDGIGCNGCFGKDAFLDVAAGYKGEPKPVVRKQIPHSIEEMVKVINGVFGGD